MRLLLIILLAFLSGCSLLSPQSNLPMHTYVLNDPVSSNAISIKGNKTLLVSTLDAPQWLNTQQMAYSLAPNEINYFADHQWASPPQSLMQPIIIHALSQSGLYRAVVSPPFAGSVDERLDIKLISMQQNFCQKPSVYQIVLQLQLINDQTDTPIAARRLSASAVAISDDPEGGIKAANQALSQLLPQVVQFCKQYG